MVDRQKPVTTPPDHGGLWTPQVVEPSYVNPYKS